MYNASIKEITYQKKAFFVHIKWSNIKYNPNKTYKLSMVCKFS